jgi:hypothetical protein
MSSEIYELLKRPDELYVVDKAHRRPRFVEDVVREMLRAVLEEYPTCRTTPSCWPARRTSRASTTTTPSPSATARWTRSAPSSPAGLRGAAHAARRVARRLGRDEGRAMPEYLFVTGRLAAGALRATLERLELEGGHEVAVLDGSVAALMRTEWIARRLPDARGCRRVMIPGLCRGDLDVPRGAARRAGRARTEGPQGPAARLRAGAASSRATASTTRASSPRSSRPGA